LLPDFDIAMPPLKDLLERGMENRLELRINAQQVKLAQAQLYVATGNIIPDPTFMIGSSKANNPPSGPKLSGFWFTMTIDMPAFSYSQGDITRLKATIKQLHAQQAALNNQITAEISGAYSNLLIARNRIKAYQERLLNESEEIARLARRSYEVGQSDITATLAAQQSNIYTRVQYLEAVQGYQQAFTDLEQSIGEPLQ
jgi:outer membrane protein TolC